MDTAAPRAFLWTPAKEEAARQLASDALKDEEIARRAGVSRMTLHNWKKHPEFAARVAQHVAEYSAALRQRWREETEKHLDEFYRKR